MSFSHRREFRIYIDGSYHSKVHATDEDHALSKWLDEQGYDSIEHAASEHFIDADEITAVASEGNSLFD